MKAMFRANIIQRLNSWNVQKGNYTASLTTLEINRAEEIVIILASPPTSVVENLGRES